MKLKELVTENTEKNLIGVKVDGRTYTVDGIDVPINDDIGLPSMSLTSLYGIPKIIHGDFRCRYNKLTSLKDGPTEIYGLLNCSHNKIESLVDGPKTVHGHYLCADNALTSLKGMPNEVKRVNCSKNLLTSLEYAPKIVNGSFDCSNNKICSLKDIHKMMTRISGKFTCNQDAYSNDIESHVLGLILIEDLKSVEINKDFTLNKIINRHLRKGRQGVMDCQRELIDAGYEEFAKM